MEINFFFLKKRTVTSSSLYDIEVPLKNNKKLIRLLREYIDGIKPVPADYSCLAICVNKG